MYLFGHEYFDDLTFDNKTFDEVHVDDICVGDLYFGDLHFRLWLIRHIFRRSYFSAIFRPAKGHTVDLRSIQAAMKNLESIHTHAH